MKTRFLSLLLLLALLLPAAARAAQEAIIVVEQAAVREMPSLDAKIIESKPSGSSVRVSSYSKDGWYRIKSNLGQFGWIWQGDIKLETFSSDTKAANLDFPERPHDYRPAKRQPLLYLRGGAGLIPTFSQIGEISPSLEAGISAYAQAALRLTDDLRLSLRLMSFSDVFQIAENGNPQDLTGNGTALLIGFEQDISKSDTGAWWIAFYGGIDLSSSISGNTGVTNTLGLATSYPNVVLNSDSTSMTINATGYAFLLDFGYAHHFSNWFSLVGEAGLFYNYIPALDMPALGTQHISEYGPIVTIAAQFSLNF